MKGFKLSSVLFAALLCLVFVKDAFAYLDPGSGSYFIQLIIGILLGCLFALKAYWNRIKIYIADVFRKK